MSGLPHLGWILNDWCWETEFSHEIHRQLAVNKLAVWNTPLTCHLAHPFGELETRARTEVTKLTRYNLYLGGTPVECRLVEILYYPPLEPSDGRRCATSVTLRDLYSTRMVAHTRGARAPAGKLSIFSTFDLP